MSIPIHVAIVDQTGKVDQAELAQVAGALNAQVQNDFVPIWLVRATVGAYPAVPQHTWAIIIEETLNDPGALGYHTDENNQPISYVMYQNGDYSVTASHELLEMLGDPWGNRVTSALCPANTNYSDFGLKTKDDPVSYLVEVADPCEATNYLISGVNVSDFLTPNWYRSAAVGGNYSHAGGCNAPREVADGGYVSFNNPHTNEWYQVFNEGGSLRVSDLGKFDKKSFGSLREWVDTKAREFRAF